jgi:hypothetical protein
MQDGPHTRPLEPGVMKSLLFSSTRTIISRPGHANIAGAGLQPSPWEISCQWLNNWRQVSSHTQFLMIPPAAIQN